MRSVRGLLQAEAAAVTAVALWLYATQTEASWLLLMVLWLVPDVGLLGFLRGNRAGAIAYNVTHSALGPVAMAGVGAAFDLELMLAIGLIWTTHVGIDRAIGYGLKSSWSAKHTHLQQLTDPASGAEASRSGTEATV